MKECKRLKCPKNKGLQGFARVRKRAKALPNNEVTRQVELAKKSVKSMISGLW